MLNEKNEKKTPIFKKDLKKQNLNWVHHRN